MSCCSTIKIWDIRKLSSTSKKPNETKASYPYRGTSKKLCGFADLIVDSSRSRLYASCMDHIVYEYDMNSMSTRPSKLFCSFFCVIVRMYACLLVYKTFAKAIIGNINIFGISSLGIGLSGVAGCIFEALNISLVISTPGARS